MDGYTTSRNKFKKILPGLLAVGLVIFGMVMVDRSRPTIPIYPYEKINWDWILSLEGQDKIDANARVAVLPHDASSFKELTQFYRGLAVANPNVETVVVISPNHFEKGTSNVQTDARGFQTTTGTLYPSNSLVKNLQLRGVGKVENVTFGKEHGITMQANYLKMFFPKADFLPIVLKASTTSAEVDALVVWLTDTLPSKKTLVLGSIDFSHYLNKAAADKNDAVTLAQIKSMDSDQLPTSDVKCEFLDSPMSLRAVIQYSKTVGAEELTVARHDNSATVTSRPNLASTTSHFYLTWSGV